MPNSLLQLTEKNASQYFDAWLKLYQDPKINPFFFLPMDEPREVMEKLFWKFVNNPNARFFMYLDEHQKPIGTTRITYFTGARKHAAELNAVAIDPNIQGKGLGTEMLLAIEKFIQADNKAVTQIELGFEGDNPAGRKFYEIHLGYQVKINYENWWYREKELLKSYPWYTAERYSVKYLEKPTSIEIKIMRPILEAIPTLDEKHQLKKYTNEDLKFILAGYSETEQKELTKMLTKSKKENTYILQQGNHVLAILCFNHYQETRLPHAVTMPCVAFSSVLDVKTIAAFIHAAMQQHKKDHPKLFHFACSEVDTEEQWYTHQHSKILQLTTALQLAGFEVTGIFEHYFPNNALIGFECCFLGLQDALKCLNLSIHMNDEQKKLLTNLLNLLLKFEKQLTHHEAYEIYRLVRYLAYPDHLSSKEIEIKIKHSEDLLSKGLNYNFYQTDLKKLISTIREINQQVKLDTTLLLLNTDNKQESLPNNLPSPQFS